MKCPKCNYISFDYLDSCKKCGKDLSEHKEKHNIQSLLFAGAGTAAVAESAMAPEAATEDGDFTFGLMEDEEQVAAPVDESGLATPEPTAAPVDDPFSAGDDADEFSFDNDDSFSFDDDEL